MNQSRKYLQQASSEIQRAAEAMDVTINELQREIDNHEVNTKRKISDLESDISRAESRRISASDAVKTVYFSNEIREKRKEIKQLQQEHEQVKNNDKQKITDMQQKKNDIDQYAKDLNNIIATLE